MTPALPPQTSIATLPDGRQFEIPWYLPSPRAVRDREKLLASQWFLVNISKGPAGEIWRCRRCRGKHRFLTQNCVEKPFSGLTGGLFAFYHTVGSHGAEGFLTPAERARFEAIGRRMNPGAADLATSHPEMARRVSESERDADLGALALGVLEPITPAKARDLVRRINLRAGKDILVLPGLT